MTTKSAKKRELVPMQRWLQHEIVRILPAISQAVAKA